MSKLCSFCKHPYVNPCDGKNAACQNKLFKEGKLRALDTTTMKPKPKKGKKR